METARSSANSRKAAAVLNLAGKIEARRPAIFRTQPARSTQRRPPVISLRPDSPGLVRCWLALTGLWRLALGEVELDGVE
jgi:hypothetical protein